MEPRKLIEMFSIALSTLFAKMKEPLSIKVCYTSNYLADIWNETLFICLILMLTIILANLIRPRSKHKHMQTTSGDEVQTQTLINKSVRLNLYIFKKLAI